MKQHLHREEAASKSTAGIGQPLRTPLHDSKNKKIVVSKPLPPCSPAITGPDQPPFPFWCVVRDSGIIKQKTDRFSRTELDWTLHARGILSTAAEDGVVHTKGGTTLLAVATLASSTRGGSAVHATRVLQRVVLGVAAAKGLVDLVTEYAA